MKKAVYRVQGISFPDEALLDAARLRAASERRSLSNYICGLVEADLAAEMRDAPSKLPSRQGQAVNYDKRKVSLEPLSEGQRIAKKASDSGQHAPEE